MAKATFTITGLKEIQRAYRELPKTVASKVIRQAMRKAVKPVAARVKELTPRDTGKLAKATKVRARKKKKRGVIAIDVVQGEGGSFKAAVFHGGFQNYGTAKIEGQHYFERAFDETKEAAARQLSSEIAGGIVREALRLAGGLGVGVSPGSSGGGSGSSAGGASGAPSVRARDSQGRFLSSK